jgi:hypothetical protein
MNLRLVRLPYVPQGWETAHAIRVLEIDGEAPALEVIAKLHESDQTAFRMLSATLALIGTSKRVMNQHRVRKDGKGRPVYEIKLGHSVIRFWFFYTPDDAIAVLTEGCLNAKDSKATQAGYFDRCESLRIAFAAANDPKV